MSPIILKQNSTQHISSVMGLELISMGYKEVFGDQGVRKTKSCQIPLQAEFAEDITEVSS